MSRFVVGGRRSHRRAGGRTAVGSVRRRKAGTRQVVRLGGIRRVVSLVVGYKAVADGS
jgi:hypothetical protein